MWQSAWRSGQFDTRRFRGIGELPAPMQKSMNSDLACMQFRKLSAGAIPQMPATFVLERVQLEHFDCNVFEKSHFSY